LKRKFELRSKPVPDERLDDRLWQGALILMATPLVAGLILISALALGWNSPGPTQPPDWQPAELPIRLDASPEYTSSKLLGWKSADFKLEVQARLLSSPDLGGYGLIYRAQDASHYYAFAVSSDGYYAVLRMTGSEEIALAEWQQFPHIRRGQQLNRLRVACSGSICQFYVNDEFATTIEDRAWLKGNVGLWVRSSGDRKVSVQFLDVRAWDGR
jgi:hypothetical protein